MLQVQAFVASMEREKARQRTYSAMRRKAEAGQREALQPDVIDAAVTRAMQLQAEAVKDREAPRKVAEDRLKALDAEIVRLTNAMALGGELPPLLEALRARQAERERVTASLTAKATTPMSLATSKKEIRVRLEEWRELLQRQIPQARQILKKLLERFS